MQAFGKPRIKVVRSSTQRVQSSTSWSHRELRSEALIGELTVGSVHLAPSAHGVDRSRSTPIWRQIESVPFPVHQHCGEEQSVATAACSTFRLPRSHDTSRREYPLRKRCPGLRTIPIREFPRAVPLARTTGAKFESGKAPCRKMIAERVGQSVDFFGCLATTRSFSLSYVACGMIFLLTN